MVDIYVGPQGISFPIHEKLLCYYSPVLRSHFYKKGSKATSYGLEDDTPETFALLTGWLYSNTLSYPLSEPDVGKLIDLYLLSDKLEMGKLGADVVSTVRTYYHNNAAYPSLRRVQYVYDSTSQDNPLREMMVGSIARFLTLGESIPKHWDNALRKNGQLAVDIIRAIQEWHLEGRSVPDAREGSTRGFSGVRSDVGDSVLGTETEGGRSAEGSVNGR